MSDAIMTLEQFEEIGNKMFPDAPSGRWGRKMADATGLSYPTIVNIRRGIAPISRKSESRILAAYNRFKRPANASVDFGDSEFGGDASFLLSLTVRDIVTNKIVGIHNVDPKKFFPQFAPVETQPVIQNQTIIQNVTGGKATASPVVEVETNETDEEIMNRISKRFAVASDMASTVLNGAVPSMILYGLPGLGKSYTIMKEVKRAQENGVHVEIIKGAVRTPAILQALFRARNGGVVVFDDSDGVFADEETLNLMKAALDSEDVRRISWLKQSPWLSQLASDEGVEVDEIRNFDFMGGVIFITNKNIREMSERNDRMAEHFSALMSRSMFIDLSISTVRERIVHVSNVFVNSMGHDLGLNDDEINEIVEFMKENAHRLNEISFRMAKIIANVFTGSKNWKEIVEITKMKN